MKKVGGNLKQKNFLTKIFSKNKNSTKKNFAHKLKKKKSLLKTKPKSKQLYFESNLKNTKNRKN